MSFEKNNGSKWLIKSEGEVLGPFSYDQVIDQLKKKKISLIDEIRDPETRWLYIRENPMFKSVIEEIQNIQDNHFEDTKASQTISKTIEDQIQKTTTNFDELPTFDTPESLLVHIDNETVTKINEKPREHIHQPKSTSARGIKKYISETDISAKTQFRTTLKKITTFLIIMAIVLAGLVVGYNYFRRSSSAKAEAELIQKIKSYKFQGLNSKVAESFPGLSRPSQKKLLPDLLEVYPILESTGAIDIADIDSLKTESVLTSDQKSYIELIYFQKEIKNNNLKEAQTRILNAAGLKPSSYLVKENQALLNIKNNQFKTAFDIYSNILKQEVNGRYLLGYAMSLFGMSQQDRGQYAREVVTAIDKYTTLNYDFRKELLLVQLALAFELSDSLLIKVTKPIFFNTPVRMSDNYVRPELLAFDSYNWSELASIKNYVKSKLHNDEAVVFQLHDYLESGQISDAVDYNKNNNEKINDLAIRSQLDLLVFESQNRIPEIKAVYLSKKLKMDSELNNFIIAKNKIEASWNEDITEELKFFESRQSFFYRDWIKVMRLMNSKKSQEIKSFLNNHFISNNNFKPALTLKSMVN